MNEQLPLLRVLLVYFVRALKMLTKVRGLAYLVFGLTLFVCGTIVNIAQVISFILIRPFNVHWFRKLNYYYEYAVFSIFVCAARWWATTKLTVYTNKSDWKKYYGKEHSLCIMNHLCEVDWIMGQCFLDNIQMLGGLKAFMKTAVKYVPIIGWVYYFTDFIFLSRSFEKDKDIILQQVKGLTTYQYPLWLGLFPEGTRITPAKHKLALDFLAERNMKPLKHHLVPRTKGFTTMMPLLRENFAAIYDIELIFGETSATPSLKSMIMGKHFDAHVYVKRIPMSEVPDNEEGQEQFLRDLFYKKDRLLDSFKQTGDFFTLSNVPREEAVDFKRRLTPLLNFFVWMTISMGSIIYYLTKLIISGDYISLTVCTVIMGLFYILMNKGVSVTRVKRDKSS